MDNFRAEGTEGGKVEKAGDIREHMEDDNRGASRATHETPEEIRHLSRPQTSREGGRNGGKREFHHLSTAAAAAEARA